MAAVSPRDLRWEKEGIGLGLDCSFVCVLVLNKSKPIKRVLSAPAESFC